LFLSYSVFKQRSTRYPALLYKRACKVRLDHSLLAPQAQSQRMKKSASYQGGPQSVTQKVRITIWCGIAFGMSFLFASLRYLF
jgi:hypothetical protein